MPVESKVNVHKCPREEQPLQVPVKASDKHPNVQQERKSGYGLGFRA